MDLFKEPEFRIQLDGYEDDAGPCAFFVDTEGELVAIECPYSYEDRLTIWPREARMLAAALLAAADQIDPPSMGPFLDTTIKRIQEQLDSGVRMPRPRKTTDG